MLLTRLSLLCFKKENTRRRSRWVSWLFRPNWPRNRFRDIYSVAITDKAELRGWKNKVSPSVWSLKTLKWTKPRPKLWWENKNQDIMLYYKKNCERQRWRGEQNRNDDHSQKTETKPEDKLAWDGFMWPGLWKARDVIGCWTRVELVRVVLRRHVCQIHLNIIHRPTVTLLKNDKAKSQPTMDVCLSVILNKL